MSTLPFHRVDNGSGVIMTYQNECCTLEKCDIFDFMYQYVGMTVLHPGGLKATNKLTDACSITTQTKVLDIACGKGTSAIYLAKTFGCRVVGVDISPELIEDAKNLARKKKMEHLVQFQQADALDLPFPQNEFDATISQAVLVLVKNKKKVVQEALRVVRPGGSLGWIELSWKKPPSARFLKDVSDVLCAFCMQNVLPFEKWKTLFRGSGMTHLEARLFSMESSGLAHMLSSEGLVNSMKVAIRYLTRPRIRERMQTMNRFFKEHADIFGYGIYTGQKK